jgi:hypothetical protein
VPCAASRVAASRAVMPAAKAKTVQQTRRSCGDQMETPLSATLGSGQRQRTARLATGEPGGWRRCCHFCGHPHACRTVDSLLGSRVGRGVLAAPDHNSAVAFGGGPPVRRNDP